MNVAMSSIPWKCGQYSDSGTASAVDEINIIQFEQTLNKWCVNEHILVANRDCTVYYFFPQIDQKKIVTML